MNLQKMIFLFILSAWGFHPAVASPSGESTHTVCPSGCDHDTIRGAVNAAVSGDTIELLFTSPHTEYDIVINKSVSIVGLGDTDTIVQAASAPGIAPNRVFFVTSGLVVNFSDMTIRYGVANGHGGGLYNQGSDITLKNVIVRENEGTDGGGIYSAGGALTLENVSVNLNSAGDEGGGVYSAGTLNVTGGRLSNNESARRGGGVFNLGDAIIRDGRVQSNEVPLAGGFNIQGGGIYSSGTLAVIDSLISANDMGGSNTPGSFHGGGGIFIDSGELVLLDSFISQNSVGDNMDGGGLFLLGTETTIYRSSIENNHALGASSDGGGLAATAGDLLITDTAIRNNDGRLGGGINLESASATIRFSTVQGNAGVSGGGLFICNPQTEITLTNVTVSGSQATLNGGGIWVCFSGEISLANITISDNTADSDGDNSGNGGGLYLETFNSDSGVANLRNTLIDGNADLSTLTGVRAHDCFGEFNSEGYNLIGTLGFQVLGTPCTVAGDPTGNQIGVDAMLDALADNGGPTLTHALLPASPAINAGDPAGCTDPSGAPVPTDQRHGLRPDRCDLGAFELAALVHQVALPIALR